MRLESRTTESLSAAEDVSETSSGAKLAVIRVEEGQSSLAALAGVVEILRSGGVLVAGYLQLELSDGAEVVLEDIETTERFGIMQALGTSAGSCRLDTQALAAIAGRGLSRLEQPADLLVLTRFGKAEAEGHGLRAVLEKALDLDIPILTSVASTYFDEWNAYVGQLSVNLSPNVQEVLTWFRSIAPADLRDRHSSAQGA